MARRKLKEKYRKKPYAEAEDDEKVARNWKKTIGLYQRGEYSSATLRAAICMELMTNFAIRDELVTTKGLPIDFVNTLLKDANGIHRKFTGILLPIMEEYEEHPRLKQLWNGPIKRLNERRNKIAHGGEFDNGPSVKKLLDEAREAIVEVMDIFGSDQKFPEP
ncbi:MAG: hypothetical protein CMI67_24540 [Pelagibaca sp.]|nr:hypothetical protein [Pelagibaca sp.]